jgi:hypothetical protein
MELTSIITVVSRESMLEALWKSYQSYFGSTPKRESIWILVTQWALETGWGNSMHCFNIGNVKSREGDGYDHQFYACNEILDRSIAESHVKKDPSHTKITSYIKNDKAIIWYYPPHPECRFRAFHTLLEGTTDYIGLLNQRFCKAWPYVISGDIIGFSHQLKLQGYYTADEAKYTNGMKSVYDGLSKMKFNYDSLPFITLQEQEEINTIMAMNLNNLVNEDTDPDLKLDE